jgi:hypothetical protein
MTNSKWCEVFYQSEIITLDIATQRYEETVTAIKVEPPERLA